MPRSSKFCVYHLKVHPILLPTIEAVICPSGGLHFVCGSTVGWRGRKTGGELSRKMVPLTAGFEQPF